LSPLAMTKTTRAPKAAPSTWPITEKGTSATSMTRASAAPSVAAGLMWQPETGPITHAITSSDKPKARAIPRGADRAGFDVIPRA
jgi:hypothetical protein